LDIEPTDSRDERGRAPDRPRGSGELAQRPVAGETHQTPSGGFDVVAQDLLVAVKEHTPPLIPESRRESGRSDNVSEHDSREGPIGARRRKPVGDLTADGVDREAEV